MLLPEWAAVRNRPQRNAYHRFTVDRHLLEAAAQAAPLATRVSRPDLLLVGALLHDIGKGFPGDHTDVGVQVVGEMGTPHGLLARGRGHPGRPGPQSPPALRRRHPARPRRPGHRRGGGREPCGDRAQLELLAALTEADSLATGPAAWGQWKAGLVADLVRRVTTYLAGGEVGRPDAARHRPAPRLHGPGRSDWAARSWPPTPPTSPSWPGTDPGSCPRSPACSPSAASTSAPPTSRARTGFAVETFVVEPSRGRWPDFELVADQLEAVLRGTFPLEERLAEQARAYAEGRRSVSSRPVEVHVDVDNAASASSTVVEVRAEDDVGLLHRITAALFALELDVVAARVSTFGHEVARRLLRPRRHDGRKGHRPRADRGRSKTASSRAINASHNGRRAAPG